MRCTLSPIERTFRALLRLYPADFQTEFREEMLEVAMASWKEKRMSGFMEKCRAFLKEAAGLLLLAPREWMRSFLKRPLSPVGAGVRSALALAIGVLLSRLIESALGPLGDTSFVLYQVAVLVMRIAFYALIGLVTGLLLKASRTGPLVVAWVLGSIASYGVRLAIDQILGNSLSLLTISGQLILNVPAYAIFGLIVGLGFRQIRINGRKPQFPVLKSMLAFVAVSAFSMLNTTFTYARYMQIGWPLSLASCSSSAIRTSRGKALRDDKRPPGVGGLRFFHRAPAFRPRPAYFFTSVSVQSRPFSMMATISSIWGFVMIRGGEMKM
jgi:hypothetical protein